MIKYVLGFAFSKDEEFILLMIKNRPTWQAGKLNGIGGKIEDGETEQQAMVREFKEETGVATTIEQWNWFAELKFENAIIHCFKTHLEDIHEAKTLTDERLEVHPVTKRILMTSAVQNVPWLILAALYENDCCITANYDI